MVRFWFNFLTVGLSQFGIVFIIVPGILADNLSCSGGWKLFKDQCYWVINSPEGFNAARDFCAQQDSTLASVPNENVYSFLWNLTEQIRSNPSCATIIQACETVVGETCPNNTANCGINTCRNANCTQFWTGLYKYNPDSAGGSFVRNGWVWLRDNTTYDSNSGWNKWNDNEPSGGSSCARLGVFNQSMNGYFGDIECKSNFSYICQRDAIPMSVSSTLPAVHSPTSFSSNDGAGTLNVIGLSVGVTLGVLLIIIIVAVVIIVRSRKRNGTTCNINSCYHWKREEDDIPPQHEYTETFKRSLQPWSRETLRGHSDRAYKDSNSDLSDVIDPYCTTSTRIGDYDNQMYPYSNTKVAEPADDVDSINPYSVHHPLPNTQAEVISDYAAIDSDGPPTSGMPVYSVPDKTKKKTPIAGFLRGIQKRFSSTSQDVAPVYAVPNKPGMQGNTMDI